MVETNEQTNDGSIPDIDIKSIEEQISKMDAKEKSALIAKLASEKDAELKSKEEQYNKELTELKMKFGKAVDDKDQIVNLLMTKIDTMDKKFEDTFGKLKVDRQGMTNTAQNPFKEPKDVLKDLKDPRKWGENPDLKKAVFDEVMSKLQ